MTGEREGKDPLYKDRVTPRPIDDQPDESRQPTRPQDARRAPKTRKERRP